MKLIGLLSWFDEPERDLRRAIETFHAVGMTHLVAVDGAYGIFPGGAPTSAPGQAAEVAATCERLGVDVRIYLPTHTWSTETEKRAFLFELAQAQFAPTLEDWYWVIDADEYVEDGEVFDAAAGGTRHITNPRDVKQWLSQLGSDAADVKVVEPGGGGNARKEFDIRKLFRCLPGMTVANNHHTYMAGQRVLWGFGQEPSADLTDIRIVHTTNLRAARRRKVKEDYYVARDQAGIEKQSGCWECGGDAPLRVRSSFVFDVGRDKLRSTNFRTCERHAARLRYENRHDLRTIARQLIAAAPPGADIEIAAANLAAHLQKHDAAEAFVSPGEDLMSTIVEAFDQEVSRA